MKQNLKPADSIEKIIVTGSIAYDDIMVFPGEFKDHFHPERLHQINISFVVDSLSKHIGGTATNIAHASRLLSDKPVQVLGAMGKDHAEITGFFHAHGIGYDGSVIDKDLYTSTGKVITDKKDNQLWGYYYGASVNGDQIDFTPYAKQSFFIISANHPRAFLHAQTYCINNRIPYLYDPGMALTWISDDDLLNGILHCQFLVGNDYEIAQILRRISQSASELVKHGVAIITTLGADGVRYQSQDICIQCSGYPVKKTIDPTGAGDAWRGAFIAALSMDKTLHEALIYGNTCASIAVEYHGTVNYQIDFTDFQKRVALIRRRSKASQ